MSVAASEGLAQQGDMSAGASPAVGGHAAVEPGMQVDVPVTTGLLYQARRMGLLGGMGLLMLVGAAWVHFSALPAQRLAVAQSESDVRQARHKLLAAEPVAATAVSMVQIEQPDQAWQALADGLPDQSRRTALQAEVLATAKAQGLLVQSVKWRGGVESWASQPRLWRQRMQIPVEGRYTAVRQWVDALLKQKALSLDAIELQRADLMGDQVKAQVSVSLWWRLAPKGP
jgi:Tfp pilus assembly protein PilO